MRQQLVPIAWREATRPRLARATIFMDRLGDRLERHVVPLTFLAALALGILRRPAAILAPIFFQEDALFYADARAGAPIWQPYAGYLHLLARLIATLQAPLAPAGAALLGTIAALAVSALVAAFVASGRLRGVLPDPLLRLAVALLIVLIPQGGEALGAPSHVQWYLAIFLVALVFADAPSRPRDRWLERAGVVVAGLTTPLGIVLLPLYWLRARRLLPWLAAPVVVQLAILAGSPRAAGGYPLSLLVEIVARRAVDQSIIGLFASKLSSISLPLAVVLVGLLAAAFRSLPRRLWLPGLYALAVPLAVGLAVNPTRTAEMLEPWAAQRYFMVVGFVLAAGILMAAWQRRGSVQLLLAVLLLAGIASSFRLVARPPL